jgi:hypothetical protein
MHLGHAAASISLLLRNPAIPVLHMGSLCPFPHNFQKENFLSGDPPPVYASSFEVSRDACLRFSMKRGADVVALFPKFSKMFQERTTRTNE